MSKQTMSPRGSSVSLWQQNNFLHRWQITLQTSVLEVRCSVHWQVSHCLSVRKAYLVRSSVAVGIRCRQAIVPSSSCDERRPFASTDSSKSRLGTFGTVTLARKFVASAHIPATDLGSLYYLRGYPSPNDKRRSFFNANISLSHAGDYRDIPGETSVAVCGH